MRSQTHTHANAKVHEQLHAHARAGRHPVFVMRQLDYVLSEIMAAMLIAKNLEEFAELRVAF